MNILLYLFLAVICFWCVQGIAIIIYVKESTNEVERFRLSVAELILWAIIAIVFYFILF